MEGYLMLAPEAKRGGIYKRLETDAEYRVRLVAAGKFPPSNASGPGLDTHGETVGIQRRIVESSAD